MPTLPTTETIYSHDYRPAENTNHTKDKTNDDFKMSQRATINVDVKWSTLGTHKHGLLQLPALGCPDTLVTI